MSSLSVGVGVIFLLAGSAGQPEPKRYAQVFTPQVDNHEISCATALSTGGRLDQDLRWWALGYWSGRNSESYSLVGSQTDSNGVIAEIEKSCREEPSILFISAVARTYTRLKASRR